MACRGRPVFDLNEPPTEEDEESDGVLCFPSQKPLPISNPRTSDFCVSSEGCQRLSNNQAFSHASSVSGFQPFVRSKEAHNFKECVKQKDGQNLPESLSSQTGLSMREVLHNNNADNFHSKSTSSPVVVDSGDESQFKQSVTGGVTNPQAVEREEGEWSDIDGAIDASGSNKINSHEMKVAENGGTSSIYKQEMNSATGRYSPNCSGNSLKKVSDVKAETDSGKNVENSYSNVDDMKNVKEHPDSVKTSEHTNLGRSREDTDIAKNESTHPSFGSESVSSELASKHLESNAREDLHADEFEESSGSVKQKDIKGLEAGLVSKGSANLGKRPQIDQKKEAMLGKKRSRQTVFLNLEDVKQAGPIKTSTPRRQASFPSPMITRMVKDTSRANHSPAERSLEREGQPLIKEQKQADMLSNEGNNPSEIEQKRADSNGEINPGNQVRFKKLNSVSDFPGEVYPSPIPRQSSWKQLAESKQPKNPQLPNRKQVILNQTREIVDTKWGSKKPMPLSKKQTMISMQYQDTSVERLLREVTNDKFWHNPEEAELQCVPGRFESVEEYVRVFEPLLFEECRAQLYSTWEELNEAVSRDAHIMVRIKNVDRRERGWYDVTVLPMRECKWTFKEGDVAILSSARPGTVRPKRSSTACASEDGLESEATGRVAGTVRRYVPIDTRDPPGAILHFYVGDTYDPSSKVDDDHVLRKFQPRSIWYLTVLGSLATTQREYVALHAFRRLNLQMQNAILKPSPEHFPKYEQQPPAMPECFTPNFVDHLHRTFNGPQLAAIQWAAMHTAAGTSSSGITKRQDPWPFTLVQGPPGTGKTHTVWGMLNVIHLVQYQHYYTALLKKLAPESYKPANENNPGSASTGSIDEVLQSMDQSLFRTLPKLCPKPRMLVCAPSNAATDELLARVLDRGFIDGEMKVYWPDVARVGVDSQTRAAQAVSVERRTELLLSKPREEIIGHMQQLRLREAQSSQHISNLQRELTVSAAAGRSQGSVGVDPDVLVARDHNRDSLLQQLAAAVEGRDKVLVEMSRLLILEGRFRAGSNFNLEDARSNLEASFANEAEVVFTTVSSSGRKLFSRLTHGFDMVVIDEAAQASEVAVLPPLALGAARCVLVGDPQQLPATVISKAAGTLLYSRSLFERFQQAGCPTMLLSVQYRMHPQIRDFPSRYFYQGRLTDSESVANLPDETYYKDPLLKPYVFYDITHGRESHRGGSVSYQNVHEAQFCLRLYEHLQKISKASGGGKISVGIITPYKLQLNCLKREFEEVLNSEEGRDLYINTVDAFQGQERDVIIMSCVRASNHGVGFVADIRRMNVALTRARRALWVVGNATALVQSDDWAALIEDSKDRNCFVDMDSIPKEFLVPKPSSYTPLQGRPPNMRSLRTGGPKHRPLDMLQEPNSGAQAEEDERSSVSRNGGHKNSISLDDPGQSGDKFRDAWQHGISKRQGSAVTVKRDL